MSNFLRWFAFTVRPQHERLAVEQITPLAQGVRLPVEIKHIRRHRRANATRKVRVPLMAGYVFAGFAAPDEAIPWRLITNLSGVRNVIATPAGRPLVLRSDWAEQMDYSRIELPEGEGRPLGWEAGDTVTITEGALRGQLAQVERIDGEKARVLVDMFNTSAPAIICVRQAVLAHRRQAGFPRRSP